MTKRKRKKRKGAKPSPRPRPEDKGSWISSIPTIWKWLIFVFGIPSLYIGILSLLPRISVKVGDPLGVYAPLSAPVAISNDGYVELHDVKLDCLIDRITNANSTLTNMLGHQAVNFYIGDLAADGYTTTFCGIPVHMAIPIINAHMKVIISYRPDFLPWRKTKDFNFTGVSHKDGSLLWVQTSN